jgi:hypothetical protein
MTGPSLPGVITGVPALQDSKAARGGSDPHTAYADGGASHDDRTTASVVRGQDNDSGGVRARSVGEPGVARLTDGRAQDSHLYLWIRWSCLFIGPGRWKGADTHTDCNRLYPSQDRLMAHRKRDHDTDDTSSIITWGSP